MNTTMKSSTNGLAHARVVRKSICAVTKPLVRVSAVHGSNATAPTTAPDADPTPAPATANESFSDDGPAKFIMHQLPALAAELQPAASAAVLPLLVLGFFALSASPAEAIPQHHYDLSEEMDLLSNVVRYGRFFITVMLGTVSIMTRPFAALFKNPLTGLLALGALAGAIYGTKFTLELMLGVSEVDTMANSVLGY